MATLIVDIETAGYEWNKISSIARDDLTNWIYNSRYSSSERDERLQEIKNKLSFSPLTGKIISIGMYDIEREIGAVYFVSEKPDKDFKDESFTYKVRNEKEILEDFWDGARSYDTFVTFNGRSFVLPFLHHRSIINNLRPSVEIAKQRYIGSQTMPYHVDLLDEFTFYGAMKPRPSLQILCDAYGVGYSSELRGEDVGEFFRKKKFTDIAKRNASDILAIKSLYEIWKKNLAPVTFLNILEM